MAARRPIRRLAKICHGGIVDLREVDGFRRVRHENLSSYFDWVADVVEFMFDEMSDLQRERALRRMKEP